MNFTKRLLSLALAGVIALGVTYQPASAKQESVIEKIKKRGAIKIGLSVFVPWSMRDKNGDLIGFELDVGRQLAKDMGVKAEFVPTSWDGIIPALVSGNFDVIISGMTVTPQRNLTVNFSIPYAYSGMTILANKASTKGWTLNDYNKESVTFAARRGATPADAIAEMFPKAKLLLFDEDGAATQEVLNGNADATMASEPSPSADARRNPETLYVPFDQTFNAGGEGFAFRKSDVDALAYFNSWITMRTNTGWLKKHHDYWFKGDAWQSMVSQ